LGQNKKEIIWEQSKAKEGKGKGDTLRTLGMNSHFEGGEF
jgi:hypothetical protein